MQSEFATEQVNSTTTAPASPAHDSSMPSGPAAGPGDWTSVNVGDYVADEHQFNALKLALDKKWAVVRSAAETAARHQQQGNHLEYRSAVKVMLFWHEAKDTTYIEDLVKSKIKRKYKAKVSHGINFAPLIEVLWTGLEAPDLPTNKANRISRALNRLYQVFGSQFKFRLDAEDQLVEYVIRSGGINGLVSYRQGEAELAEDQAPDITRDREAIKRAAEIRKAAIQKAYQDSLNYFKAKSDLPPAGLPEDIPVNEDDVSLVLVNRTTPGSYTVIDTVLDREQISQAVTRSYLSQYGTLPPALRFVAETLATQCCPAEHDATYIRILNEASKMSGVSRTRAIRRLVYRHGAGNFLLSNVSARHGLVTVATPKLAVLESAVDDVALSTMSRRSLERYLVSPRNFRMLNFSKAIGMGALPRSGDDELTHAMKIEVLFAQENGANVQIPVYFHREPVDRQPLSQVDVDERDATPPQWERLLPAHWLRQFNAAFTNNWVSSHARHINRAHQTVLDLQFLPSSLTVNFFNLDGKSDLHTLVMVPAGPLANGRRRSFLSKDFAIAMLQLAELPIVGHVQMALYAGYLKLSYETEVGVYSVYIPAVESTGERLNDGFSQYSMQCEIPQDVAQGPQDDSNHADGMDAEVQ